MSPRALVVGGTSGIGRGGCRSVIPRSKSWAKWKENSQEVFICKFGATQSCKMGQPRVANTF
eukprot:scaffold276255_cov26-Prasinocladus_malaysianus.AAC.1